MKRKIVLIILWLFLLFFLGTIIINVYMISSTKKQILEINSLLNEKDWDAILILGCKAYPTHPSEMLGLRLDKGREVYNRLSTKILLSGDHGKNNYDEVNVMKDYLLERDISQEDVFLDHAGFSTYDSIYRAKYVFGVKKMVIVTQEYHLYRALYLANQLGIEAYGIKAENLPYKSIMVKNYIREILSRDKNFFKGLFKPKSKYVGEKISLDQSGEITQG